MTTGWKCLFVFFGLLTSDVDENVQRSVTVGQCSSLDSIFIEVVHLQDIRSGLFQLFAGKRRREQMEQSGALVIYEEHPRRVELCVQLTYLIHAWVALTLRPDRTGDIPSAAHKGLEEVETNAAIRSCRDHR